MRARLIVISSISGEHTAQVAVCAENSNPTILMMKAAENRS